MIFLCTPAEFRPKFGSELAFVSEAPIAAWETAVANHLPEPFLTPGVRRRHPTVCPIKRQCCICENESAKRKQLVQRSRRCQSKQSSDERGLPGDVGLW
jgi:hypothetical protein